MKITIECEPKEIADLVTGITKPTIRLSDSNREALQKQFNAYQERFDKEVVTYWIERYCTKYDMKVLKMNRIIRALAIVSIVMNALNISLIVCQFIFQN